MARDEFHPDAHPDATDITGERDYGEWGQCVATAKSANRRCRAPAKGPHGKCGTHGGDTPSAEENPDQGRGDQEGNDNAVTHGAFRKHFTSHLTDAEQEAFDEARKALEDPSDAKDIARTAAVICLLQYDRTQDERFMRRFESLCEKFSIAPEDVERHEHTGEGGGPIEVNIKRERYDG